MAISSGSVQVQVVEGHAGGNKNTCACIIVLTCNVKITSAMLSHKLADLQKALGLIHIAANARVIQNDLL